MTKPKYHVASFSGGKDSTAMVLHMIERHDPLDEVLHCDPTMEFPAMYRHIEKVKKVVGDAGIKFTTLRSERNFEHYLAEIDVPNRKHSYKNYGVSGYGWPSHKNRWCTTYLKTDLIEKYVRKLKQDYEVIQYIGVAWDEDYRLERANNQNPHHRHPLREWEWSEADALQYCYDRGYDWEGLYTIFHRVSCWCCPLQSYDELRKLRQHFPDLWQELHRLDRRQWNTFIHGYTIEEFDRRFALEETLTAAGESIKNRRFFADLKRHLSGEASVEDILRERTEEGAL